MKYTISPCGTRLTLTAATEDIANWKEEREDKPDSAGTDQEMAQCLENLLCNSELEWLPEGTTNDLTDAPILAILGEAEKGDPGHHEGYTSAGFWDNSPQRQPVLHRWGWMAYQVKSLIDELIKKGEAVLQGGPIHAKATSASR